METTAPDSLYAGITVSALSLLQLSIALMIVLPLAVTAGFYTGRWQRRRRLARGADVDISIGDTSLGAILALLGLILAFTFGNALSTFQVQKQALLAESSALGTAFQRADYLPEPGRTTLQADLLAYAKTRVIPDGGVGHSRAELNAFLATTMAAQDRLWPDTLAATRATGPDGAELVPPPVQTFAAGAVNAVLDAHLARIQTFSVPVSEVSLLMTLSIALLALYLLAFREAINGNAITWRTFVFATMLWVVMVTILDTQRGQSGFVQEDDGVLRATISGMEQALATPPATQ